MDERVVFTAGSKVFLDLEDFCNEVGADDAWLDVDGSAVLEFEDGTVRVAVLKEGQWQWAE